MIIIIIYEMMRFIEDQMGKHFFHSVHFDGNAILGKWTIRLRNFN